MSSDALERALGQAQTLGFIGARPLTDHLAQAEAVLQVAAVSRPELLVDLGSGGGVPGLSLALRLSSCEVVLVEAMQKRATFLEMQLRPLGIEEHCTVRLSPAEDLAYSTEYHHRVDVVTARGFGPPSMTAEIAAGFLRPGGVLVVTVMGDAVEKSWPPQALMELGYAEIRYHPGVWPLIECVMGMGGAPPQFPRLRNLPRRRPLFGKSAPS